MMKSSHKASPSRLTSRPENRSSASASAAPAGAAKTPVSNASPPEFSSGRQLSDAPCPTPIASSRARG